MSFLATVEQARAFLERNGRVSLRALQREFDLDADALEELIEELVGVQRVALRDGGTLAWADGSPPPPPAEAKAQNPPREPRGEIPRHLAEKILRSRPALEGERKQVTVLFADVKGSTELTEQAGAERWAGILDGYLRILEAGVHRFEGTVSQYTGDGIMALFGAPIAHEDHAQRACLAALWLRDALRAYAEQIQREHGLELRARIGLNSGEVVVGKIGDDLGMDYTAQGQTVHLAQRMEQRAGADRPCLAPATAALVEGFFALDDLGEVEVKGVSQPLRVHALAGVGQAHTRLDAARSRGLSRFVGRVHEMESLEATLSQAREGHGQIVGVVGEAGVGKSRLCAQFLDRARAGGMAVYEAHCLSHGKTVSFLPILELLRALLGVSDGETEPEQRRRVADELIALDPSFDDVLPLALDFLGVSDPEQPAPPMEAEARQRQLFDFVRQLVRARSAHEAVVLFLDDAHWIDAGSDAFLARIAEAVADTRALLLVNFRPEYQAAWMGRSEYQQLPLRQLAAEEIEALLDALIGADASLGGLRALIGERTGGNPFFVEEVVRSLAESGALEGSRGAYRLVESIETLEVPTTVQPVLAGRIDRLAEREKQGLQAASVIGREFSEPILSAVLDWPAVDLSEALQALKDGEFVYEQSLYPVTEYAFKHPLTQEVALGSQLQGRRARTHAAVAQALEAAHPDRLDEQASLIALHYEGADEALEAARWYRRAAEWQAVSGDLDFDTAYWERVYELAGSEPATPESEGLLLDACAGLLMHAPIFGIPMDERDRLAAEGRALAERLGERSSALYTIELGLTTARILSGWSSEGPLVPARRAVEIAADLDLRSRAESRFQLGNTLFHMGRLPEALDVSGEALELVGHDSELRVSAFPISIAHFASWQVACCLLWTGRPREAATRFEGCLELARERQEYAVEWLVGTWYGPPFEELIGTSTQALAGCRRAVEIAEGSGSPFMRLFAWLYLGWAQLMRGDVEEALELLLRADHLQREREIGTVQWNLGQGLLAEAHLAAGDAANARTVANRCTADRDAWVFELRAHLSRARVLRALDGPDARGEVEAALERAQRLLEKSGARAFAPMIIEERARLLQVLGDAEGAARALREAQRAFAGVDATGNVERLGRELGS